MKYNEVFTWRTFAHSTTQKDMDTGQRTADVVNWPNFQSPIGPTGAGSIWLATPQLDDQPDTRKDYKIECVKRNIFEELNEVNDYLESDNACSSPEPKVEGGLKEQKAENRRT